MMYINMGVGAFKLMVTVAVKRVCKIVIK